MAYLNVVFVNANREGTTVRVDDVDLESTIGDFVSSFRADHRLNSDYSVMFNSGALPELSTFEEVGIVGNGETITLSQRNRPA